MNSLLLTLALLFGLGVSLFIPTYGPSAVLVGVLCAVVAGSIIYQTGGEHRQFLVSLFIIALLVRMSLGTLIFSFNLQSFFGGDALTYDEFGFSLLQVWQGNSEYMSNPDIWFSGGGWGMLYGVAIVYAAIGRNMLAIQYINCVFGAATAPLAFHCARHIFQNLRVARITIYLVAFFPSLVLWSSQGLKDGPIVFLLALSMVATLKLGERLAVKHLVALLIALLGLLSLRFYVFYMAIAAVGGAFLIGMRQITSQSLIRQFLIILAIGLTMTYLGVLRRAGDQLETYGNLERVQQSRADLATAQSGFAKDVDVSTNSGALAAIPIGATYLLFAPFPWELANLRQSLTLPEMLVWWASFPLLVTGMWFTLRYRMRQAMPILIFTTMLTLAYSIFQGNVGTAYRQRSQLLVFYFIFVSVGAVLLKERREERERLLRLKKEESLRAAQERKARRRYRQWRLEREREWSDIARGLSEKMDNR